MKKKIGTVYFVGAGPGDPELITRKGARLLSQADCVIYDRLVDPDLLKLTGPRCQRIYMGKEPDEGGRRQPKINRLLREKARQHRAIVRLKGGEPTLFGRISEELEGLVRDGIPFEIVPGVSSVWAAAAAAGIPLTDRRWSSSVAIVTGHRAVVRPPSAVATGHEAAGKGSKVRWEALAKGVDTLVILMGRAALPAIARRLQKAGRPASTPVALIRWASTPQQEVMISTLGRLEKDLAEHLSFDPPVVAVVGKVVLRHQQFKPQPLKGKRILITRPVGDSAVLRKRLQEMGAVCVHLPTIAIRPRQIPVAEAKTFIEKLPHYDWIIFTSHHGVDALSRLLRRHRVRMTRGKICAIGPRTAQSVRESGLSVDLTPADFSKDGIQRAFRRIPVKGKRICIPRSNLGMGDYLSNGLRRRGALVDEVVMYETVMPQISPARLKQTLHHLDGATFTSASTVRSFLQAVKQAHLPLRAVFNGAAVVAIGPATGKVLREGGIKRFSMPDGSWTVDGLVKAVVEAVR